MMLKLAIIGGGRMAGIFAEHAKKMQVESHCFSPENGIVNGSLFDYIHPVNILEKEKVLEICRILKIDGVVATTELTVAVAAYVADQMNLKGIPLNNAEVITDKLRNRDVTKSVAGLSQPGYARVNSAEEILALGFKYPIIVKPTAKGGKRGITVVFNESDVKNAFEYAMKDSGGALPLIVEEYISGGMECSVESLSYNGKNYIVQVTEKVTSGAPHCVELAHHQPAAISPEMRKKVEEVMDRCLSAIGVENGTCHSEIKIKDNEIYLIECNARPGGDHIADPLTELSTGYPYIEGAIDVALDRFKGIDTASFKKKKAGVLFVTEQTKELLPIFEKCESYPWCYKKNQVSDELQSIVHNNGFNINYFMYYSDERPDFTEVMK